ncbi:MAG TPA: XdhC family protein [Burkholderiaceae bacterium]|jgi:xanthine/CO dehydrogenase XdhC/CoxF family maturation factor|nr:XdhC family protein [Burkholderiaceae bacterium]
MSELSNVLRAYEKVSRGGRTAALASVVSVSGSTYRRIGAHMLVTEDGEVTGAISGGCLERDICRHATWVMQSGEAKHLVYDSTGDDEAEDAFALGCNGVVEVLVERLLPEDPTMGFLAGCLRRGESGVVATIFAGGPDGDSKSCSRLLWCPNGTTLAIGIRSARLVQSLSENARNVLASGKSAALTIGEGAGRAAACFEIVKPSSQLVIFGGGHDAIPLAAFAKALGTRVVVVDPRPGHATRTRFPSAERLIVAEPQDAVGLIALDDNSSAVVMHHNYGLDFVALQALLPKPISYLGVLGPKRRTVRLLADLARSGSVATQTQLARLHGPAGLDLGAETPEEVALAIVAEMKAALAGRSGGPARERNGPLHQRTEPLSDSMCQMKHRVEYPAGTLMTETI